MVSLPKVAKEIGAIRVKKSIFGKLILQYRRKLKQINWPRHDGSKAQLSDTDQMTEWRNFDASDLSLMMEFSEVMPGLGMENGIIVNINKQN